MCCCQSRFYLLRNMEFYIHLHANYIYMSFDEVRKRARERWSKHHCTLISFTLDYQHMQSMTFFSLEHFACVYPGRSITYHTRGSVCVSLQEDSKLLASCSGACLGGVKVPSQRVGRNFPFAIGKIYSAHVPNQRETLENWRRRRRTSAIVGRPTRTPGIWDLDL